MVLTVLLSLAAIHPFLSLGSRSFELFDPTSLVTNFFMEFIEWSQRASENRYWAFDRSFQYHFYKQAESSLNGISTLIKISWDEAYLKDQPFMFLLGGIPRLFNNYLHQKRKIPTKSLWFLQKPKFDYWYLSSSHVVGIAASTQTDIAPKTEFDTRWVENLLFQFERESLSKCLVKERHYDVATIMDHLNTMVSKLGREWDVEYACTEIIAIKNDVINISPLKIEKGKFIEAPQTLREKVGIVDYLGLLPISLFLEFQKRVVNTNLDNLSNQLEHLEWEKVQSIYTLNLPFSILDRLEFVQERLTFETEAEGKLVSAPWYIKQLVFQTIATLIQDQIQSLLRQSQSIYNTVDYFIDKQGYLYAATLSIRGLEFYSKILHLLGEIIKQWETLGNAYVEKSIPWPANKWNAIKGIFSDATRNLMIKYAKLIPFLSQIEKQDEMPDYFGRVVHVVGEQCFNALQDNNLDDFKELFPYYFMGSLSEHDVLRKTTQDWQVEQKLLAISGPVIDLCHLSGYALFFAEFHQTQQLWIECKTVWDKYLEQNGKEKLDVLAAFIAYESNLFAITDRGLLRTQWEMAIKNLLRTLPRKSIRSSPLPNLVSRVDHPSPLEQTMGGSQDWIGSPYDGGDIFVELHLKTLDISKGLEFGQNKNLVESLAKLRKQKKKADESKK